MSGSCLGRVSVLSWSCLVSVMSRCCFGDVSVMSSCLCVGSVVSRCCFGDVSVMSRSCLGRVSVLSLSFFGDVCLGVVLVMFL